MLRKVGKPPLALRLMSQRSRELSISHMSIGLENKAIESGSVFYKGVLHFVYLIPLNNLQFWI